VIVVGWEQPGPVSKVHEELLKTFADQAVIAIENVRLFKEAQEARAAAEGAERGEERVPRDDEPRDPHADERGDRHERAAARHAARRRAARLRGDDPRSGDALLTIINDILDFSKIEAGGWTSSAPVRSARVRRVGARSRQHARAEKQLDVAYVFEGDVPRQSTAT
jgi:signal transduction histidine kinase